jgi:chemotaxis protein methyltransferase CheR
MKILGHESYSSYLRYLQNDGEEVQRLIYTITINVTEFMRDVTPFKFFMNHVLPRIAERKKRVKSNLMRFWSAGCSCGEEPYSIAICALETLGSNWNFSIYATDIDEECLEAAREGYYKTSQLKNLDRGLIERYFEREDDGYRVKSFLKRYIRFKKHDLTTEEPVSRYLDAIFCRNVMIYFNEQQKSKIMNDFYGALIDEGYLIIGKSETLPHGFKNKFECVDLREKVYRKIKRD